MRATKYYFPNQVIQQMNIPFTVKIATTDPDDIVMTQLKSASTKINEKLAQIDQTFSPFRFDSLVSKYQRGDNNPLLYSSDFQSVYGQTILAEQMTDGIFTPYFAGRYDPTGLVKGWAIEQSFDEFLMPLLEDTNIDGVSLNGGGDLKFATKPSSDFHWGIGIENPHNLQKVIATYYLQNGAIATSGNSKRGEHIIRKYPSDVQQVTVVSDSLVDADIWATVGVAAGLAKFTDFVNEYKLSGMLINGNHAPINFNEGTIANAQKTPL
ncbi:FAD:protein FMN transferase [Companilactobacillus nantensis]|uniref:FAD:protein FMN transferase n=1 Tax=Companilactobacillus nantensis DSM 16982 TaxID=1423774 RepID=A0A0R1WHK7_9LACO|nr:FAD:protein FMN transferase [Companilactobacillus nantensis]KRM17328.1 hypothetical protein FD31_GL000216 [Companilactobacillus nantensis DSM 16982]GEO63956.1 hypothetical protein LNA01_11390 [Companilactobacillus nantensis]